VQFPEEQKLYRLVKTRACADAVATSAGIDETANANEAPAASIRIFEMLRRGVLVTVVPPWQTPIILPLRTNMSTATFGLSWNCENPKEPPHCFVGRPSVVEVCACSESRIRARARTLAPARNRCPSLYNARVRILISAGEASGEMYGAQLIEALRRRDPSLEFFGVGGDRMRAAGCDTVVDAKDLAVVGISEIVSHLPKIYGLFHRLIAEADRRRPDLAVVIDSPAFNWRVARQMRKRGIPVVYYVCPQFWAWRQGRVRLLRKYVNKALVIFPFEEKFYRDRGVDATFVGHPLADLSPPSGRDAFAADYQLDVKKPWITLMPGSRMKEVRMNLPTILESAARLGSGYQFLLPVAPTLDRTFLESLIAGQSAIRLVSDALPALAYSRAGIIASGTATVEAAMMGLPFVMVYRVSPLTYLLGRSRVKVSHFAMVNLIAGKEIVPELVQQDFTAENVIAQMNKILVDGQSRTRMVEGLATVRALLRGANSDGLHPAERAAEAVGTLLRRSPVAT
jgi:lipid-A-disaccharide synthase